VHAMALLMAEGKPVHDLPNDAAESMLAVCTALWKARAELARSYPDNTCPASRHLHGVALQLARGWTLQPRYAAESMLSVLESLWKARSELAKLKETP